MKIVIEDLFTSPKLKSHPEAIEGRMLKEFLAGGGTKKEFNRRKKLADRYHTILKQQIDDEKFYGCGGGSFYVSKGRKPG